MLVSFNTPPGYKEYVIYFIVLSFGYFNIIVNWMENMKPYVPEFVKSYEETSIRSNTCIQGYR